ncbi:sulfotransferase family protein [Aliiruegeria lutimaris]|uniref:Sulfotransferase domain-containing protein n=1 Tax=Aliiruegeria lutimaris TaxID=571298 RepID=A0A1G9DVB9_9RHOB|nr:sulfotransferase [Aliiruegeria lutimaris]SDK67802.1 Sulfotransferase domain-containing protein [Aliiruegeria lutimaris]
MTKGNPETSSRTGQTSFEVPIWARSRNGVAFADVPRRGGGRMPDFCIIGAAKAGTTALNQILDRHPDIYMNPLKEPHYFSTKAIRNYGEDWYRGLYSDALPDQICGEASTSYTRHPLVYGTAERMAAANPAMKLIYLLREPVKRIESECLQIQKYCQNVLGVSCVEHSLDEVLDAVENPDDPRYSAVIATSRYIEQIEAFETHFPGEQLLVVFQDDLYREADAVIHRVCDFLDVDPFLLAGEATRLNVTADFINASMWARQTEKFRRLPFYDVAKSLLPMSAKSRILSFMSSTGEEEFKLSEKRRCSLVEAFREPNRRLEARIGNLPRSWE